MQGACQVPRHAQGAGGCVKFRGWKVQGGDKGQSRCKGMHKVQLLAQHMVTRGTQCSHRGTRLSNT